MSIATAQTGKPTPTYPANVIADYLRNELTEAVRAEANRKGRELPETIDKVLLAVIEIDSLTVVEILCVLDDILPFEVGESVVRAGGYSSINEAVKHLVKNIEQEWRNHHGGGKS
ncbi:MAG: hypothetical protein ACLQME_21150 [Alphaproteobacteria bacterium]